MHSHSQSTTALLLEPGIVDDASAQEEAKPTTSLERANTVASACRPWLEIFIFRIFPNMRIHVTKNTKPITVRAVVTRRTSDGLSFSITIKGVARHSRLPGRVRFCWHTSIWDSPKLRQISWKVGRGEVEHIGRKVRFTLESSKDNVLWVRILDSKGEPSPIWYSLGRGKMNPRPRIDYEK